jgi:hypothetical protein
MLDEIKGRAPTAANDLLRFTRRIFAFGVRRRFLLSNSAADFSPAWTPVVPNGRAAAR